MNDRLHPDSVLVAKKSTPVRALMRLRWPSRRSLLLLAAGLAGLAVAVGIWQTTSSRPPATGLGRSVSAGTPALAPSVRSEQEPTVLVAAATSPASAAKSTVPVETLPSSHELSALKGAHDQLAQHAVAADQRLDRIESEVARLRRQLEEQQLAVTRARVQADSAAPQPRVVQPKQQRVAQPRPYVLGVDVWNGQPSVSVLMATEVRFFSEGDVVADALVRRADPVSQRVEFVTASGVLVTASPPAGEAR